MSLFTDLQNAGLPVISATDNAQATFSRCLSEQEMETYLNILFPMRVVYAARKHAAKANAQTASAIKTQTIDTIDLWVDDNFQAMSPQQRAAIREMCRVLVSLWDEKFPDRLEGSGSGSQGSSKK